MWKGVVLPAITWLYGWVEWQMGSVHVPSIVEREHRAAFASATERVTEAMRAQPDRLAACIWRAMVALLTHVRHRPAARIMRPALTRNPDPRPDPPMPKPHAPPQEE